MNNLISNKSSQAQEKPKGKFTKADLKRSTILSQAADELDYVLTLSIEDINKFRRPKKASFRRLKVLLDLFFKEDPKAAHEEMKAADAKFSDLF